MNNKQWGIFWRALGAKQEVREGDLFPGLYIGDYAVGENQEPAFREYAIDWRDPYVANVEVLLDGLARLARNKYAEKEYDDDDRFEVLLNHYQIEHPDGWGGFPAKAWVWSVGAGYRHNEVYEGEWWLDGWHEEAVHTDRRTAIIRAICKLVGIEAE